MRAANSRKDSDRYQLKTSTTTNGKLPSIKTPVPGPKSKEIFELEQKYIAPGRQRISLLAGLAFDHGEGATLTDADGNTYVDFFAGVAVASLGHAHPGMADALSKQAARLTVGTFATKELAAAPRRSKPRCAWRVPRPGTTKRSASGAAFMARRAACSA